MTDPLRHQFIRPNLKDLIPNLGNPLKLRHLGPGRFQNDYRAPLGVPPVCYVMAMVVDVGELVTWQDVTHLQKEIPDRRRAKIVLASFPAAHESYVTHSLTPMAT